MKIEKINDNQIRCTLTREDLASRHLKISELAYGSEKTRALFQDMMSQASVDFGFETDDLPLMIEAIPLSPEKVVLIITKVETPDELDLRFSNFTHSDEDEASGETEEPGLPPEDSAGELMHLLDQIRNNMEAPAQKAESGADTDAPVRLFTFTDMDAAMEAAQAVSSVYHGDSTLYRDPATGRYQLVLRRGAHSALEFHKIMHALDSYLEKRKYTPGIEAYCREHCRLIVADHALQTLAEIQ